MLCPHPHPGTCKIVNTTSPISAPTQVFPVKPFILSVGYAR